MSKPNNALATVKIPGDSTARPIVPYYLGYSASNNYVATIPNITADKTIALANYSNTFTGMQTFTDTGADAPVEIVFDNTSNSAFYIFDNDVGYSIYFDINGTLTQDEFLHFPAKSGTLATTDDCSPVVIYDLRS